MKNSKDKLYTFTLIACIVVLLVAFILTLVNVLDLRITSDKEFPAWIEFVGNSLFYFVNIYIIYKKCISTKTFKCLLLYIPFYLIFTPIIGVNLITTCFIPILVLSAYSLLFSNKNNKAKPIITCVLFFVVIAIYQPISGFVKIGLLHLNYNFVNFIEGILFSIDFIVFLILIERRVDLYAIFMGLASKRFVSTKTKSVQRVQKTSKTHLSTEGLTRKQAVVFMALAFGFQLFQLCVVLAIGQINNMFLETITILGVFWAARKTVGKCYHADTLLKCSAITFISFYVLTKVTPPLEISLFSVVCITAIYVYILHAVEMKREHIEYLESVISPENTMRKQCSDLGMSYLLTEICIDWKINGLSRQEQADKHGYSIATIKKFRNDINKALK